MYTKDGVINRYIFKKYKKVTFSFLVIWPKEPEKEAGRNNGAYSLFHWHRGEGVFSTFR